MNPDTVYKVYSDGFIISFTTIVVVVIITSRTLDLWQRLSLCRKKQPEHKQSEPKRKLTAKAELFSETFKEMLGPYKKYVGFVAMAVVIDHFILGGGLTGKITEMLENAREKRS